MYVLLETRKVKMNFFVGNKWNLFPRENISDDWAGLRTLDLSLNHLGTIPPAVKYLSALTELNLGENEISELNGDFMLSGSSLTILGLRGNRIKNILPQSFNSTPKLETLDLGDNQVETLHQATFVPLGRLRGLSLAGNLLTDINGLLTSHPALTHLNVSNNQLKG